MHKWYVLQVYSAQEKKVKQALEEHKDLKGMSDLLEQVLLPIENVSEPVYHRANAYRVRRMPAYGFRLQWRTA